MARRLFAKSHDWGMVPVRTGQHCPADHGDCLGADLLAMGGLVISDYWLLGLQPDRSGPPTDERQLCTY